jgi:hypothetical protein
LTCTQKKCIKVALKFSRLVENTMRMNYDASVTEATLQEMFGYEIHEGKVKLKRRQNKKKAKAARPLKPSVLGASQAKKTSRNNEREKRKVPVVSKTPPRSPEATPP